MPGDSIEISGAQAVRWFMVAALMVAGILLYFSFEAESVPLVTPVAGAEQAQ